MYELLQKSMAYKRLGRLTNMREINYFYEEQREILC